MTRLHFLNFDLNSPPLRSRFMSSKRQLWVIANHGGAQCVCIMQGAHPRTRHKPAEWVAGTRSGCCVEGSVAIDATAAVEAGAETHREGKDERPLTARRHSLMPTSRGRGRSAVRRECEGGCESEKSKEPERVLLREKKRHYPRLRRPAVGSSAVDIREGKNWRRSSAKKCSRQAAHAGYQVSSNQACGTNS